MQNSVVIPIYNEQDCIWPTYLSVKEVMEGLKEPYEIIFVNDASKDDSLGILNKAASQNNKVKIINFKENSGESQATKAGFDAASGKIIISMDGDGQLDPKDIPKLLAKLNEGYDVVCGWRYERNDPWLRIISSKIANIIRRVVMREKIHDVGCCLRAYRRECLFNIPMEGQLYRFITVFLLKKGCKIAEIKVRHYPRKHGAANYNIRNRLFNSLPGFLYAARYKKTDF